MDESPDVTFYVLSEPALTAHEPDEWAIWRQNEHLRSENYYWRECVTNILHDARAHRHSSDALRAAVEGRVHHLGEQLARLYRQPSQNVS